MFDSDEYYPADLKIGRQTNGTLLVVSSYKYGDDAKIVVTYEKSSVYGI